MNLLRSCCETSSFLSNYLLTKYVLTFIFVFLRLRRLAIVVSGWATESDTIERWVFTVKCEWRKTTTWYDCSGLGQLSVGCCSLFNGISYFNELSSSVLSQKLDSLIQYHSVNLSLKKLAHRLDIGSAKVHAKNVYVIKMNINWLGEVSILSPYFGLYIKQRMRVPNMTCLCKGTFLLETSHITVIIRAWDWSRLNCPIGFCAG